MLQESQRRDDSRSFEDFGLAEGGIFSDEYSTSVFVQRLGRCFKNLSAATIRAALKTSA
ncbi:hypothetical protein HUU39_21765 [candidate division KSB1 bacterium]|nr:hypothetical protein [bacterium]NUM67862.1 hypothetical protein [candidate division KSB1 bacterium]